MPSLREAQFRHAAHFLDVLRRSPYPGRHQDDAADAEPLPTGEVWQQIEHAWGWVAESHAVDEEVARLCSEYPIAGERWFELHLLPRERADWLRTSLEAARRLGIRYSEGRHLSMLGAAYAALGDTRGAVTSDMESLTIARETGGVKERAVALLQLAGLVSMQGDDLRALKLLSLVLGLCSRFDDARVEALALSRTAATFVKLKGDDIRALLKKNPEIIARITGAEHEEEEEEFVYPPRPSRASRIEGEKARYAFELWRSAAGLSEQSADPAVTAEIERNIADAVASNLSAEMLVEDMTADLAFEKRVWGEDRIREALEAREKERSLIEMMAGREQLDQHLAEQRRKFDNARTVYEASLAFYRRGNDLRGSADIIRRLGRLASLQGHKRRALDSYKEALSLYERAGDQIGKANALVDIGGIEATLGDEVRAQALWQQAAEIYERGADVAGRYDAVGRLLGSYMRTNDPRFRETLDLHLRLMQDIKKMDSRSPTLVGMATARSRDGDTSAARELLRLAVAVDEETGDREDLVKSLCELGWLDFNEGESRRAAALWERALPLARSGDEWWLTRRVLSGLAQAAAKAGDTGRALSLAGEILGLKNDYEHYAETLNEVAGIRRESGASAEALDLYEKTLAAYEAAGDEGGQFGTFGEMINLAKERDDLDLAYKLERRMIPLLVSLKQWETLVSVLVTLGVLENSDAPGLLAQALWLALRLGGSHELGADLAAQVLYKIGVKSPDAPWVVAAGLLLMDGVEEDETKLENMIAMNLTLDMLAEAQGRTTGRRAAGLVRGEYLDRDKALAAVGRCVERLTGGHWLFDPRAVAPEEPDEPESHA
jgi:tetratricopeptide (TPR) repeat protein